MKTATRRVLPFGMPVLMEDLDSRMRPNRRRDVTYVPMTVLPVATQDEDKDPPTSY